MLGIVEEEEEEEEEIKSKEIEIPHQEIAAPSPPKTMNFMNIKAALMFKRQLANKRSLAELFSSPKLQAKEDSKV